LENYIYMVRVLSENQKTAENVVHELTAKQYAYTVKALSDPSMRAFFAKLFDLYNMSSWTEKAALDRCFYFRTNNSVITN